VLDLIADVTVELHRFETGWLMIGYNPDRLRASAVDDRFRGVVVTEAGSYLRHIDSCIIQLEAQKPSRTCNESKEEGYEPVG